MEFNEKQKLAMVGVMAGIIEAIGANGIPSGHLYAILMGKVTLSGYQAILSSLKRFGFVNESGHYLTVTDSGRRFAANKL